MREGIWFTGVVAVIALCCVAWTFGSDLGVEEPIPSGVRDITEAGDPLPRVDGMLKEKQTNPRVGARPTSATLSSETSGDGQPSGSLAGGAGSSPAGGSRTTGLRDATGRISLSGQPSDSSEVTAGKDRHLITAKVTAYCPCKICCGASADGVTAIGRDAYKTRGVAVDNILLLKVRSKITIPGAGTFLADDVGGAMRQAARRGEYHIDLRFPTHEEARQWGVQTLMIEVVHP